MSDLTDRLRVWLNSTHPTDPSKDATLIWEAADALDAAEAENAQLREHYGNLAAELGQVIVGYRQQLAAIDALHQPIEGQDEYLRPEPWCPACANPWPCPTHRILHPETGR